MDKNLSDEQMLFVKYALAGHNVLVDACIGSGKTTAIQALCNYVPTKRILYLTYNKLLKIDAKEKIRNPNVNVTNYHGFAWAELNRANIRSGLSELIATYNRKKPPCSKYDILILDEYQDVTQEIADMLLHIKESQESLQIVAVGDMEQKIYDWTRLDVRAFMNDFLGTYIPMEFTKCFRLSESLASMLGRVWKKSIVGVNPDFVCQRVHSNEVFDRIKDIDPGRLLVLGARTGKASALQNRLETKCPDKFNKKTLWSKISETDGATSPHTGCAIFTTFDGCKGMERDVCVLYDWNKAYWNIRLSKPDVQYEILRNVFLVAASRAKRQLILVDSGDILTEEDLTNDSHYYMPRGDVPMSEMFDFKYLEDVEDTYHTLEVTVVEPAGKPLSVPLNDELIDLSPCIGHYQEASYFTDYNLDTDLEFLLGQDDRAFMRRKNYESYTLDQKLLYLAALETKQLRYMNQVKTLPISENDRKAIEDRLAAKFRKGVTVQQSVSMDFYTRTGKLSFTANGILDVLDDTGMIWELKFVSALSHTHILQLAMYLAAMDQTVGRIYNTRTGELLEVRIPDMERFLDHVVQTVTKGAIRKANVRRSRTIRTKEERRALMRDTETRKGSRTDKDRFYEFFIRNRDACLAVYSDIKKQPSWKPNDVRAAFDGKGLTLPVPPGMFLLYTNQILKRKDG